MREDGIARRHIWFHDGRSLCDRRAPVVAHGPEEKDELTERSKDAPTCGSCLLAVDLLVGEAHIVVRAAGEPDLPPVRAGELLDGTRFSTWVDFAKYLPQLPDDYRGSYLGYLIGDDNDRSHA